MADKLEKGLNDFSQLTKSTYYHADNSQFSTIAKKLELNILYFDKALLDKEENSDNCCFLSLNNRGTFYGCHNLELLKLVSEKIKNGNKQFILISSGSAAKEAYHCCYNMKQIRECYIYCFQKKNYIPLMNNYIKLKGVYDDFDELVKKLCSIPKIKFEEVKSSGLIFFEDYSKIYIKLHYEIIRKYSLYKLIKKNNLNENQFLYFINKKYPYFIDLAKQMFPNKNEIINFFKKITNVKEKDLDKIFSCEDIKDFAHNYTLESFYYFYLNKFLREGDFDTFRILSSHISKFIFLLYEYRNNGKDYVPMTLYRKMNLSRDDIYVYQKSQGKTICYPSFTSTSAIINGYTPAPVEGKDLVQLIITTNGTKSVVSIKDFSKYPEEEEYLFFPFSFFKISEIYIKAGDEDNPHLFYLKAINSEKPIEEMFLDFMKNETDSLQPEGLDMILLSKKNDKLIFNKAYRKNK